MGREVWNREALYELVWSRPMTDIAKEYAISDVGLRKACLKIQVPVPQTGYWAKIRNGQEVPRPPLLPQTNKKTAEKPEKRQWDADTSISIPHILDSDLSKDYISALAFERFPANVIIVQIGIPPQTEMAKSILESLLNAVNSKHKEMTKDTLNIHVSPGSIERAAKVVDALLAAFLVRGWIFELQSKTGQSTMTVSLFGTKIAFWLEESYNSIPQVLTADEEKDKKKNPWRYTQITNDHIPSGRLSLKIETPHMFNRIPLRTSWSDGQRQKLDSILNKFCTGLILASIETRNAEISCAQWETERQEMERKRQDAERIRLIEKARQANLKHSVESYEGMIRIKQYITFVREQLKQTDHEIDSDLAAWFEWAEKQVQQRNPLAEEFPKFDVEPAATESNNSWGWAQNEPAQKSWFEKNWYDRKRK